jgi:hypothetical protein
MWDFLYSDKQLKDIRETAEKTIYHTQQPLHPDYDNGFVREMAKETIREVDRALSEREQR